MKIPEIKKWHRCDQDPPKKAGSYIFCRVSSTDDTLSIRLIEYTPEWGWNTDYRTKGEYKFEYVKDAIWAEYEITEQEEPEECER